MPLRRPDLCDLTGAAAQQVSREWPSRLTRCALTYPFKRAMLHSNMPLHLYAYRDIYICKHMYMNMCVYVYKCIIMYMYTYAYT